MVVWLLCRLEAYGRNNNFQGVPVLLPEPTIPDWPVSGFKQLMPVHKLQLPKIRRALVESYFEIRMAMDKRAMSDLKAIQKGEALLDSQRIDACSVHITQKDVHFSGMVRAAMKKKVSYNYKLRLDGQSAEILNSHCECPAGKGPHGTCKHLAAVLLMLCKFMQHGEINIRKTCTENPQTFHQPSALHSGASEGGPGGRTTSGVLATFSADLLRFLPPEHSLLHVLSKQLNILSIKVKRETPMASVQLIASLAIDTQWAIRKLTSKMAAIANQLQNDQ
ncbi:uncharacterized protein LOC135472402 [Liolophura sinensis]|uniref:uncharacterized protein LOC135472402 n=1 Tax=Liolophura sinensis TaxID=3198878 RepID=UPI003159469E